MPIDPVNPGSSPEARKLLEFLYSISGNKTLSGQHNYPGFRSGYSKRAREITGHTPAIWGQDFGFTGGAGDKDAILHRAPNMEEAIRQHREGSIITLMWHAVRPMDDEPNGWKESVQNKLTDAQWAELTRVGSPLHRRWLQQLTVVAGYLSKLRDAHVPVLWRPYHEMNGDWFWWGFRPGPQGTAALYRQMFEVFTKQFGLNNLLWVWNANKVNDEGNAGPYRDYFPGLDTVDILATDVYHSDYRDSHYTQLLELAQGKPVALGEIGAVPDPTIFIRQPRWAWFMIWSDFLDGTNSHGAIQALYNDHRVLSREGLSEAMGKVLS
jgi:mannan endo-1,4-beta-mannosidase